MHIDTAIQEVNTVWYSYEFYVSQFVSVSLKLSAAEHQRSIIEWCRLSAHFTTHTRYHVCSPHPLRYRDHLLKIRICITIARLHNYELTHLHSFIVEGNCTDRYTHVCTHIDTYLTRIHMHSHTYITYTHIL